MLGFETIGNATIIVHDKIPVLTTDPWICGEPYFGSWGMTHEIPSTQLNHIMNSEYIWFSHGHPDHLNADSLDKLSNKKILLPDHFGNRINSELSNNGLNTQVLPTAEWFELSKNIKIMCLPDHFQDAILLIAIKDNLIVDANDADYRDAHVGIIRSITKNFKRRYVLFLNNYGDADMINLYDNDSNFITPLCASKPSLGKHYEFILNKYNCNFAIPFSCFHLWQRKDNVWISKYATPLEAHSEGFDMPGAEILPAFIQVDFEKDTVIEINPKELPLVIKSPEEFGDNWTDYLEKEDFILCEDYFKRKQHLKNHFGFINLRVGGKDNIISLNTQKKTGITFEVPRNSFMTSIKYHIFDDLFIGNFMKTTLHGIKSLYPDFAPFVAKYADNGKAESQEELKVYFNHYNKGYFFNFIKIDPVGCIIKNMFNQAESVFRRSFSSQTQIFQISKKVYHFLK